MPSEGFFGGIGEGLNNFANVYMHKKQQKAQDDNRKKQDIIQALVHGVSSPNFQGDYGAVMSHMGEILGAKGKDIDRLAGGLGDMFGQGPTTPAHIGDGPDSTPGFPVVPQKTSGAFRTGPEQTEWTNQQAYSKAAAGERAKEPGRIADDARSAAKSQADIATRARNHMAVIDYNIKNRIPAQAQAQASKELNGLAASYEATGMPKDEALKAAGDQIVTKYSSKNDLTGAQVEATKAGTINKLDVPRATQVREGQRNRSLGQADTRIADAERVQAAKVSTPKLLSGGARQSMEEFEKAKAKAQNPTELAKRAKAIMETNAASTVPVAMSVEDIRKQAAQQLFQEAIDKHGIAIKNFGGELEGGMKGDTPDSQWPWLGPKAQAAAAPAAGFGPVPGTPAPQAQAAVSSKTFPSSKLAAYAQKHTNGDTNAARKELTAGGYQIVEQ